jgi:hypothetical protein
LDLLNSFLPKQFSDDEDEVDIPLAPLPDEIEVVDGDEDLDQEQDEAAPTADPDSAIQEIPDSTAVNTEVQPTPAHPLSPNPPSPSLLPDVPSPNRHLLSLQPDQPTLESHDVLDASLNPLDTTMDAVVDVVGQMDSEGVDVSDMVVSDMVVSDMVGMDMSSLGPDGITFENAHDLTQIEGEDALLGGPMMDSSMDPFAEQQISDLHVHTPE